MALVQFNFESQYLNNNTTISVVLPDRPRNMESQDFYGSGKKYQVLWLLHGTYGDHSDWIRKSMIEIYAREKNLICVMPSALNSDYVNWPHFGMGFDMESHIMKELRPLIYNWFPASAKKEDNYIAGLSMGGYGTWKLILDHPDSFEAAAILSGVTEPIENADWDGSNPSAKMYTVRNTRFKNQLSNAGGKDEFIRQFDLTAKMFSAYEQGHLPKLLFGCGTEDPGYQNFKNLEAKCREKNLPVEFGELPGVGHEWRFWDPFIQTALKFFNLDDKIDKATLF